ncbi:MAG: FHA domain-containing protein [Myxococcota bacterium]|nr:FHA domain-containing protein [Myxococcota bacterium]
MTCPHCGHVNQAGSVFCEQCGTRLASAPAAGPVCPRCGGANQPHMRFCVHCGHGLAASPAPAPVAPVAPRAPAAPVAAPAPYGAPVAAPYAAPASPHAPSSPLGGAAGGAVAPTPFGAASPLAGGVASPTPVGASSQAARAAAAIGGPICGRCRGVGDPGALVCKFCGARYADFVGREDVHTTAHGPHQTDGFAGVQSTLATDVRLVAILKDGSDGAAHAIHVPSTDLGRTEGDVRFPDDPYLSARHARLRKDANRWFLRDLDSINGVFLRIREPVELRSGDVILLGQQVLRFELLDDAELPLGPASVQGVMVFGTPETTRFARLVQYTTEGVGRDVHYLYRDDTVLGRETGDIVFTDDPFLSRRHASIAFERSTRRAVLKDLGSSNGTSLRLRGEHELRIGDQFRVGRHLFRFDGNGQR